MRKNKSTKKKFKVGLLWNKDDASRLIRLYPKMANKDLAVNFGRPVWGVIGKARKLNLKKDFAAGYRRQYPLSCSRWSTEEMSLLRKLFSTTTNEEIAEKIGRTIDAIANKARKMCLRKNKFWTEREDEMLEKSYKTLTFQELAKRMGRTIGSVKIRVIKLGLECKVENWTETESDFLRSNYRTMGYRAIAEHLGRTYGGVAERARRTGITKNSRLHHQK